MQTKKSTSLANITTNTPSKWQTNHNDNRRLTYQPSLHGQLDAQYDSGINSLNSKGTPMGDQSLQNDSLSTRRKSRNLSNWRSLSIEENLSEKLTNYLRSNDIPKGSKQASFEAQNKTAFIDFTRTLLAGLKNFMTSIEGVSPGNGRYDQTKIKYTALKWKYTLIMKLLEEYETLHKRTEAQAAVLAQSRAAPSLATSKSRFSSWTHLFRGGRSSRVEVPVSSAPKSTFDVAERKRMLEIESQVADMAGFLLLRLKENQSCRYLKSTTTTFNIKMSLSDQVTDKTASLANLPSYFSVAEIQTSSQGRLARSSTTSDRPGNQEWVFSCDIVRSKQQSYYDGFLPVFTETDRFQFTSTECMLPLIPGAFLVADITPDSSKRSCSGSTSSTSTPSNSMSRRAPSRLQSPRRRMMLKVTSNRKLKRTFDVNTMLTVEPQEFRLELTLMMNPYLEMEVQWLPLTQNDLEALERYPLSQILPLEASRSLSGEESLGGSNSLLLPRDRRRQRELSPVAGSGFGVGEGDLGGQQEGSFDLMRSEAEEQQPDGTDPRLRLNPRTTERNAHSLFIKDPYDSSVSSSQQHQDYEELECRTPLEDSDHDEGNFTVAQEAGDSIQNNIDFNYLFDTLQKELNAVNSQQNRYYHILNNLSRVLRDLQDQLPESTKDTPLHKPHQVMEKAELDLAHSLSMLDLAIGETPTTTIPVINVAVPYRTTGWEELDAVVSWHLRNISHLLSRLAPSLDMTDNNNGDRLPIKDDLVAMALDAQSKVLSDITGLVLSYEETKDPLRVLLSVRCLGFCGAIDPTAQGGVVGCEGKTALFPRSFWARLVWQRAPNGFMEQIASTTSHWPSGSEEYGDLRPCLMIKRTWLQEFLLEEYKSLAPNEEAQQSLEDAIEILIEQLTDLDLTDINAWHEIPLTQLCHRLEIQNYQTLSQFESALLRPSSYIYRSSGSLNRSPMSPINGTHSTASSSATSAPENAIGLALSYLMKQGTLQHELRECDEENLFRTLETLVDNLVMKESRTDLRSDLKDMSVVNVICLALTLQHEDDSVTALASRVVGALEDLTRTAYGMTLQSTILPFLRAHGPCSAFLKSLTCFSKRMLAGVTRSRIDSMLYARRPASSDGYSLLSPVGSAILWAMQPSSMEEYRLAALAAWECISTPLSVGRSGSKANRIRAAAGSNEEKNPIQAEVKRMNLADDSPDVRRLALRIIMARKKFRSTAAMNLKLSG